MKNTLYYFYVNPKSNHQLNNNSIQHNLSWFWYKWLCTPTFHHQHHFHQQKLNSPVKNTNCMQRWRRHESHIYERKVRVKVCFRREVWIIYIIDELQKEIRLICIQPYLPWGGLVARPPQHFCDCLGTVIARTLIFFYFS